MPEQHAAAERERCIRQAAQSTSVRDSVALSSTATPASSAAAAGAAAVAEEALLFPFRLAMVPGSARAMGWMDYFMPVLDQRQLCAVWAQEIIERVQRLRSNFRGGTADDPSSVDFVPDRRPTTVPTSCLTDDQPPSRQMALGCVRAARPLFRPAALFPLPVCRDRIPFPIRLSVARAWP